MKAERMRPGLRPAWTNAGIRVWAIVGAILVASVSLAGLAGSGIARIPGAFGGGSTTQASGASGSGVLLHLNFTSRCIPGGCSGTNPLGTINSTNCSRQVNQVVYCTVSIYANLYVEDLQVNYLQPTPTSYYFISSNPTLPWLNPSGPAWFDLTLWFHVNKQKGTVFGTVYFFCY